MTESNGLTTITEFLLARIAEDEADARGSDGDRWAWRITPPGERMKSVLVADGVYGSQIVHARESLTRSSAAHIARWDPARALAECQANRRIVDEHLPSQQHSDQVRVDAPALCCTCGQYPSSPISVRDHTCTRRRLRQPPGLPACVGSAMTDVTCGVWVYWWDGECEGCCELPDGHGGDHWDGLSWFDSDGECTDHNHVDANERFMPPTGGVQTWP